MKNWLEIKLGTFAHYNSIKTFAIGIILITQKGVIEVLRILGTSPDDEFFTSGEFHHRAFIKLNRIRKT